jgi:phage gp29-like protein
MVMLYDHLGKPIRTGELTKELAGPSLTGVRSVWDQSAAFGLTPYRLAGLLQSAAEGDADAYLLLAEEMEEKDLHYRCELGKRKLAVSSLPAVVEAASDEPDDVKLADEIRALIKRAGFRSLLKDLLDGLGKGYSVCEIIWQRGAKWQPARYEWRDPRFFVFDRLTRRRVRLRDEANLAEGVELAAYKFIVHLPHLKTGLPIRGGLARVAAWSWMCKNYTVKDWLAFAEVFGMPLRIGKYQSGARKEDIAILKAAVANLGSDAAAVIPESMMIELVDSVKGVSGANAMFEKLANWLDAQVSRGILGQTATTQGTPGKLGGDDAQAEVRSDIRDDDALQLTETINRDLVRPYIDLNFGPREAYPELALREADQDDLTLLTTALEKLVPLGLRVEQSVVRDKYGLPDPADDAEVLTGPAATMPPEPAANRTATARNRADGDTPHPADLIGARAAAEPGFDPLLEPARLLLDEVGSLEEYRDRLLDLYADLDISKLGGVLERALLLADLAGRFDAL